MNPAYRKGAPILTYRPDHPVPPFGYGADHTGAWRLGRITAVRTVHGRRIIETVDGLPVAIITGRTHTLVPDDKYAIALGQSPRPVDLRALARDLMGQEWPDGAAAREAIERYMEPAHTCASDRRSCAVPGCPAVLPPAAYVEPAP